MQRKLSEKILRISSADLLTFQQVLANAKEFKVYARLYTDFLEEHLPPSIKELIQTLKSQPHQETKAPAENQALRAAFILSFLKKSASRAEDTGLEELFRRAESVILTGSPEQQGAAEIIEQFEDEIANSAIERLTIACDEYIKYLEALINAKREDYEPLILGYQLSQLDVKNIEKMRKITNPRDLPIIHSPEIFRAHDLAEDIAANKHDKLPADTRLIFLKYDVMMQLKKQLHGKSKTLADRQNKLIAFDKVLTEKITTLEKHRDNAFIHFLKVVTDILRSPFTTKRLAKTKGASVAASMRSLSSLYAKPLNPAQTAPEKTHRAPSRNR